MINTTITLTLTQYHHHTIDNQVPAEEVYILNNDFHHRICSRFYSNSWLTGMQVTPDEPKYCERDEVEQVWKESPVPELCQSEGKLQTHHKMKKVNCCGIRGINPRQDPVREPLPWKRKLINPLLTQAQKRPVLTQHPPAGTPPVFVSDPFLGVVKDVSMATDRK